MRSAPLSPEEPACYPLKPSGAKEARRDKMTPSVRCFLMWLLVLLVVFASVSGTLAAGSRRLLCDDPDDKEGNDDDCDTVRVDTSGLGKK